FKNATGLQFKLTGIQDIDVSNHPTLQWLSVAGDYNADGEMIDYELNSVNVAGCNALWELGMGNVKLQSVRLSGLPIFYALQLFQCNTQNLSVENMANLGGIECSGCSIQNLTIKNCPALTGVGCADNNLHNLIIDDSPHLYSVNAENNKLMWLDMSHVENYDVSDVSWFKVDNQTPSAMAWKLSPTEVGLRVHERMDPTRMLNLKTNGKSVTATETTIDGIRYIVFSNEGANAETLRGKTSTYEYETKWPYVWVEENSKDNNLPVRLYISNVEKPASWIRLSTNSVTALWNDPLTAPTVTRSQDYDGKLTFKSGNEKVVKVDAETGELTPVGPGRASITVTGAETDYRQAPLQVSYTVYINLRQGDVNADGVVDVADISTVLTCMAGGGNVSLELADVNHDNEVDVADISTILSIMAANSRRER
ncbi:MAG: dockerin type I repeat-containing protein, partial [Prevotella sp.]|nr:dockerin type I repeat-containing protein [Prevotella sp.]